MQGLTLDGQRIVQDVASRHGVSADAVTSLLFSLAAGNGTQAQFSHPELGGMGQWSQGGMIMVGDMFNNGLKAKVDALCTELAGALRSQPMFAHAAPSQSQSQSQSQSGGAAGVSLFVAGGRGRRWPAELGAPSSTGSQNDLHYAVFPSSRRLAIERAGHVTSYDLGDHQVFGFSQQQGGDQSLTFTSQHGLVRVADLPVVDGGQSSAERAHGATQSAEAAPSFQPPLAPIQSGAPPATTRIVHAATDEDVFAKIERLAELRTKGILTEEEFAAKKTELLARL
ncbi:MAG: SHOCT domain-containing protein [Oxalobacteraceae bacterium]|nr:MAG: SHOCT domain-containing protein [Oxalobacteraceae bacterium]